MAAKQGSSHHLSRLTEAEVIRLRAEYAAGGVSFMALAESIDYQVSEDTLRLAIRGNTWAHVPGAVPYERP
jgi:hypothetical protein